MSPKAKQLLFTPQMVAALIAAVLGGAGGTFGGFSAGASKTEVVEYRLHQVEEELKVERAAREKSDRAYNELDKRTTALEGQGARFEKQLDRFDKMLDRLFGKR